MKKILLISLILMMSCVWVGCGVETVEPQIVTENEIEMEMETIDLATMPDVIDVGMTAAIQDREEVVLIDVREQWEYDEAHIPGITLIPMSEFESRIDEVPTDKTVILACQSGVRSSRVQAYLTELGYENVHDMAGGFMAWEAAGFPIE